MKKIESFSIQRTNQLLRLLPREECEQLKPLLSAVSLQKKKLIYKVRSCIDFVYFPINGVISAMTIMDDGNAIEVATIGNEGMTGLSAFIGGETSPYEVMVQIPGDALRMRADAFKEAVDRHRCLRQIMIHYHTAFSIQLSYSIACNGLHSVEQRCCRWLLLAHDRVNSNRLLLTHEFLSIMLGVRRASITEILQRLQKLGLIRNGRGAIDIIDRPGLESAACECYGAVKQEFSRLFERQFGTCGSARR
jgi:CRP-like cAMP-binding protein